MSRLTTHTTLALAIVAIVAGTELALFAISVRGEVRDILNVLVGVVIAKFGTVYDYYFGAAKAAEPHG